MAKEEKMAWYSGRLLYERLVHGGKPLFEEKLVVFLCEDRRNIFERLSALAKNMEVEFENVEGNRVRWLFREILEIQQIMAEAIDDGTEVYFRRWDEPDSRDFEIMRYTHEHPWWLEGSDPRSE